MLAVTDTGVGMDDATRAHALRAVLHDEGAGQGHRARAGDGVRHRQAERRLHRGATASPGSGTTFRDLPPASTTRVAGAEGAADRAGSPRAAPRRSCSSRTTTRSASSRARRASAARLHGARGAQRRGGARLVVAGDVGRIDLLITDVVMPGLSGPNLAARLMQRNPKLRVLYMSGYRGATEVHGAFWGGVPLLQKPFTPSQLAERVRMALDANPGMTIAVVAAVIEHDNRFLLTRRQDGVHLAGHWEFPGGKVGARRIARRCAAA